MLLNLGVLRSTTSLTLKGLDRRLDPVAFAVGQLPGTRSNMLLQSVSGMLLALASMR